MKERVQVPKSVNSLILQVIKQVSAEYNLDYLQVLYIYQAYNKWVHEIIKNAKVEDELTAVKLPGLGTFKVSKRKSGEKEKPLYNYTKLENEEDKIKKDNAAC